MTTKKVVIQQNERRKKIHKNVEKKLLNCYPRGLVFSKNTDYIVIVISKNNKNGKGNGNNINDDNNKAVRMK